MSTAFHQNTNGQVESVGKDIMQALRIYANSTGNNWSNNLWRIERGHNTAKVSWHNRSPFGMVYGYLAAELPTELSESNLPAVERYLDGLIIEQKAANDALILARFRTAETVSKWRNPKIIPRVGDHVTYQRRTYSDKSRKLHSVWVGPYKVLAYEEDTGNCLLDLLKDSKIYPLFPTDKLRIFRSKDDFYPIPINDNAEDDEYEVERILDYDDINDKYLVKWKGYATEDNSWEPSNNLDNAKEEVQNFWADHSDKILTMKARRTARL